MRSRWAAADYLSQRVQSKPHHTAVRALTFEWQRIIWRCWRDGTPYREEVYEAALRKSVSPVVSLFDQIEVGKNPVTPPPNQPRTQLRENRKNACRITSDVTSATARSAVRCRFVR